MVSNDKKIGLALPTWEKAMAGDTPRGSDVLKLGAMAEDIGADPVWLVDHFLHEPYIDEAQFGHQFPEEWKGVKTGFWECWTLASALAVATKSIEIGTLVSNTGYRNPALMAKMVDTVEELSGGRLILGLGAGDWPSEHTFYGYEFERRVGRFEEALQIIRPMLKGEAVSFDGEFYKTHEAELRPKGPRADGPPVLIGLLDGGPRMRRLVAQYADQWNCWLVGGRVYEEVYAPVMAACEKHGRDPASLVKNAAVGICLPGHTPIDHSTKPMLGSHQELADQLSVYLEKDLHHLAVWLHPMTGEGFEGFGEVLRLMK